MNILPLYLSLLLVPEHRSSTDPKKKKNKPSLKRTQVIALQSGLTPLDCANVITPIDHPTTCWTYDSPHTTKKKLHCTSRTNAASRPTKTHKTSNTTSSSRSAPQHLTQSSSLCSIRKKKKIRQESNSQNRIPLVRSCNVVSFSF